MLTETDRLMIVLATETDTEGVMHLYREQIGRLFCYKMTNTQNGRVEKGLQVHAQRDHNSDRQAAWTLLRSAKSDRICSFKNTGISA